MQYEIVFEKPKIEVCGQRSRAGWVALASEDASGASLIVANARLSFEAACEELSACVAAKMEGIGSASIDGASWGNPAIGHASLRPGEGEVGCVLSLGAGRAD